MPVAAQTAAVWQSCSWSAQARTGWNKQNKKLRNKTRICSAGFETWCIRAWREQKTQSDTVTVIHPGSDACLIAGVDTLFRFISAVKLIWNPLSTANPPKHTLHSGRTYTDGSSSSRGSSVCVDTLGLHVWVAGKLHLNRHHASRGSRKVAFHTHALRVCPRATLSLYGCWIWQRFAVFTPERVRRRVPTGGTEGLCGRSAQWWWRGYGCSRDWVVLDANNTTDVPWLLDSSSHQQYEYRRAGTTYGYRRRLLRSLLGS